MSQSDRKGQAHQMFSASRRGFLRLSCVFPTSRVFTSGYVNTETILHFFYKTTNERGTKTVFTYAHVKWFHGQSESLSLGNGLIQNCMIGIGIGQCKLTGLRD